ncbi:MAG: amidohydrolase family protein, partial [Clostridia bacterium]|nr:amidohydrolase family protein [Clostridia bacterium]
SVLKMNQAVYNMRKYGNVPMHQAVRMASLNAAKSIGIANKKGSLTAGKDADVVIMDHRCKVLTTFVRGRKLYER